ncbi:MAG: hypothetical protein VW866_02645, partial [Hyphomicrobiales bacterium]
MIDVIGNPIPVTPFTMPEIKKIIRKIKYKRLVSKNESNIFYNVILLVFGKKLLLKSIEECLVSRIKIHLHYLFYSKLFKQSCVNKILPIIK